MPVDGPPYTTAAPKIFNRVSDNEERLNRVIARLLDEAEKLYDIMEIARFREDGANEHKAARKRYDEIAKELEEWRAVAAKEKRKREEEKVAAEKKRAAEAEKKSTADAEKKRQAEEAEKKRQEEAENKKDEELKAWRARYDAERKARIQAEEQAATELKKHKERVRKADEEFKALQTEIAETKRHADLLANYDRIRAVEQARKVLEDAKRRLQREHEEFQRKSYEAFQAQQRELRKVTEEAERHAIQKAKEISDTRKEAEGRASLTLRKEVGFDSPRDQTYNHPSAPQYRCEPKEHNIQHAEKHSRQNTRQTPYDHSRSRDYHHSQDGYQQNPHVNNQSSTKPQSRHHQKMDHHPTLDNSQHSQRAAVGLSGMPAGSVIDSYSPVAAPWEEKNPNLSAPQIPAWQGPALTIEAFEEEVDASPVLVPHSGISPTTKEQWPLPPTPIPSPKVDAYTPQETEEERLRREVAEYKANCAKMAADLERKKWVSGADSVATWQTGMKSIWEDPTKDTSKVSFQETLRGPRNNTSQGYQNETSRAQAGNPSSSKPAISVQNLHRRQPSVQHQTKRPESRTSTVTRYFEALEYSSTKHGTPKPGLSNLDTKHTWQKASGERYPSYVPPTPHRHESPPPALPPTPPRGSQVSTPAIVRPVPIRQAPSRQEAKTPKLTGLPGSWRDEQQLPAQDPRSEKDWPANVSTPSVPSPAVPTTKPYESRQPCYVSAPKYVPPPPSSYYSTANTHVRKPPFNYSVAPYYPSHPSTHGTATAISKPIAGVPSVPAHPAYHPSYASYNGKAEVVPSGHGTAGGDGSSSFPSWGDKTAAQSLGGAGAQQEAPKKEDKGKERAWF